MTTNPATAAVAKNDVELVRDSLAGNREAFGQIVSRYQSLVCSIAYSATGNLSLSEDLAQETFITAWRHLPELREPPQIRAWLRGIVKNLIKRSYRSQQREPGHASAALDEIEEFPASELLPSERAIAREEAEILWRSLERIPENYREPLLLYYWEHKSAEAVARHLDLTEEAVRQRLARGRRLLQEEVLAFVETALAKTAPGNSFTLAVTAALPLAVTSASPAMTASGGMAAVKGGMGKGLFSLGALGGFLAMLGTIFYSWKGLVDDSKSPRERQFMRRAAWVQIIIFLVVMFGSLFLAPILFERRPLIFGLACAGLTLFSAANVSVGLLYLMRRRFEIQMEDGTFFDLEGSIATRKKTSERNNRISLVWLLLFGLGCIGFPWRYHPSRSAICVAAGCLVYAWSFWRRQQLEKSPATARLWLSRIPFFSRNPIPAALAQMIGTFLLVGIICFGVPFFLNPVPMHPDLFGKALLGMGAGLLAAGLVVLLMLAGRKLGLRPSGILASALQSVLSLTPGIRSMIEKTYNPFLQRMNFTPGRRKSLVDLILRKSMVGAKFGMSATACLNNPDKRLELLAVAGKDMESAEAEIRQVLGEDRYHAFREFEKTIPDRLTVNALANQSSGLSESLREQLIGALGKARAEYPWNTDLSRRNQTGIHYPEYLTQSNVETFAHEEEEFDRSFLPQARQLLDPAQFAAFEKVQQRQRQSQISQFKTALKLFGTTTREL